MCIEISVKGNIYLNNLIYFCRQYNDTRFIVSHYWDRNEPNLLFCEAKSIDKPENKPSKPSLYTSANRQKKNKMIGSSVCFIIFSLTHVIILFLICLGDT